MAYFYTPNEAILEMLRLKVDIAFYRAEETARELEELLREQQNAWLAGNQEHE